MVDLDNSEINRSSAGGNLDSEPSQPGRFALKTCFAGWLTVDCNYRLAQWLFLRLLGLVYLSAFLSLSVQVKGLIGHDGILPADAYLSQLKAYAGPSAYWLCPTITWLSASDAFLQALAIAGVVISLLVLLGATTMPLLGLLYLLYLSLTAVGRVFLQFQWDALLLECGFLSIFLAYPGWLPPVRAKDRAAVHTGPIKIVIWLERWLLFRVMFLSGVVKLASGDPSYRNLTALTYHWYTQPLPSPIAWYMEQLPLWVQKVSEVSMFVVELLVPFLIFGPRRLRILAAFFIAGFQTMIAMTGNYCFFNLLTIALCLLLLDDIVLARFIPPRLLKAIGTVVNSGPGRFRACALSCAASAIVLLSLINLSPVAMPGIDAFAGYLSPFCIANSYGVFAVMTTQRHEIVLEGSRDGKNWQPYSFKYKPGDLKRELPWVAPHQPRLDWQMWFAALGSAEHNQWFGNFMYRVLQGSPAVLALLENNPFPEAPPKYLRAVVYDYQFSDWSQRKASGNIWLRRYVGVYFPPCSLEAIGEK
jgi:hypothetical protein